MQFRRATGVMHEQLDGQAVLLDPDAVRLVTLNAVGTLVWELLEEERTQAELVAKLLPMVRGVTAETLDVDVAAFLEELVDVGVVVTIDDPT